MVAKPQCFVLFKSEVEHLVPFVELSSLEDSNLSSLYNTLSLVGSLEYFDKRIHLALEYFHPEGGRGSMHHVVCFCWTSVIRMMVANYHSITFLPCLYYKIPADHIRLKFDNESSLKFE